MKKVSEILQPLVGTKRTFIRDGYDFIRKIKTGSHKRGFQVSFDVEALFPSIPMDEALIILEKKIRNDATLSKRTDLSPDEILALIKECVESPYFQCELGMFMQDDGVPMGGPLSCIIADLFLEDYEEKIDFVINETHIKDDWFRYRDDTWLIWEHSLQDLEAFKDYLNSLHSKIKWTYEVEKNGVLNFLDILLKRETDGSFTTTVYRKKTHSDRYLHFSSDHPLKDKISGIKTLKYRAQIYCSSKDLYTAEINHLFTVFLQNGYPQVLVSDILFQPITSNVIPTSNIDSGLDTSEEFTVGSLVLPYMREINGPIKALCKQLNINFLNRRKTNLGARIAHKRPCNNILEMKEAIYKIPCKECEVVYLGETKRKLGTRTKEHFASCQKAFLS